MRVNVVFSRDNQRVQREDVSLLLRLELCHIKSLCLALALKIGKTDPSQEDPFSVVNNNGKARCAGFNVFANTASFPNTLRMPVPRSSLGSCGQKKFGGIGDGF